MLKEKESINERVLSSIGKYNYNEYILITGSKEINSILNDRSPVYKMYKYKEKLIDSGIGQNVTVTIDDDNLKESLEQAFQEYLSDKKFKVIKDILVNHKWGWDINKLLEIHKQHKYYRVFRLLTIPYECWMD